MAITTDDQQDDGLLDAAPDQQRLTEPAPVPSAANGTDVEPLGSKSARRPAWIAVRAAIAAAVVLIMLLWGETAVAAAGEASLAQLLAVCLVAAVGLAVSRYVFRSGGPRRRSRQPTRIAIIGNQASAVGLLQELAVNKISTYEVAEHLRGGRLDCIQQRSGHAAPAAPGTGPDGGSRLARR